MGLFKKANQNKNQVVIKNDTNANIKKIYKNSKVGLGSFKPLIDKETKQPLKDIDYFELLGRKVEQLEEERPNKNIPINFASMGYDPSAVQVAKCVCKAIDEKRPKWEIEDYIKSCVQYEEEGE